jgi:hypothetical protein
LRRFKGDPRSNFLRLELFAIGSPLEETQFERSIAPGRYTAKIPDTL